MIEYKDNPDKNYNRQAIDTGKIILEQFERRAIDAKCSGHYNLKAYYNEINKLLALVDHQDIVRTTDLIFSRAIKEGAGVITIKAGHEAFCISYRIDGVFQEVMRPPAHIQKPLTVRIKIMAGLDIFEKPKSGSGRIFVRLDNKEYNLRLLHTPGRYGDYMEIEISEYLQSEKEDLKDEEYATRSSWKRLLMPEEKTLLPVEKIFTKKEYELIKHGHIPFDMDDKWFIFFEDNRLHFHRSWTGLCCYQILLESYGEGYRIKEAWANRNPDDIRLDSDSDDYDRKLIIYLINRILLGKEANFPVPSDISEKESSAFQFSMAGYSSNVKTAYFDEGFDCLYKTREFEESIKFYDKILEIDPYDEDAKRAKKAAMKAIEVEKLVESSDWKKSMGNKRIIALKGDIAKIPSEIIVNGANNSLFPERAILLRAGGTELKKECINMHNRGGCKTGEIVITVAGDLPARYVIHTVGPVWSEGEDKVEEILKNCYKNSLKSAAEYNFTSISFTPISTGKNGFPGKLAAEIAVLTVKDFLEENKEIEHILFVCNDKKNYEIYRKLLERLL